MTTAAAEANQANAFTLNVGQRFEVVDCGLRILEFLLIKSIAEITPIFSIRSIQLRHSKFRSTGKTLDGEADETALRQLSCGVTVVFRQVQIPVK